MGGWERKESRREGWKQEDRAEKRNEPGGVEGREKAGEAETGGKKKKNKSRGGTKLRE